ncbi:hypothetical protein Ais01nite_16260 [Asanoa ishikariensis]|uniref:Uncharacterized protein n=1 Tax=Asanoa ishikariensis TaxID=137265 RepID=A0A1H3UIE3_9ACTN|nr:hypothetical protein [Asanoa ishikariensis]GIF63591.1 hypothetical protein Ais01nite_16260 [Asanoa ishikariensis]SDZ61439.1 hypothetical protein SAMN05421684_7247 [Asanoa ishikariensis]
MILLLAWTIAYGVVLTLVDERPGPVSVVVGWAVVPLLWVALSQLRWAVGRVSVTDPATRLLSAAVAALPTGRRGWGRAMLAELASLEGRAARWRFALSCVRATLSLPPAGGWPVPTAVVALAVAAVAAVGRAAMPGLTVFAMTFTGLVGALAATAVARSHRPRLAVPAVVVTLGVAAAIAATVYFLRHEPATHLAAPAAVALAVALAGCLFVALAGPRSSHLGAGAGVVFAAWFLLSNRSGEPPAVLVPLLGAVLVLVPMAAFFVPAFVAGRSGRSFRPGLRAAMWTVAVAMPLTYAVWLPEALRRHAIDGRTLDGELLAPASANLADALAFCLAIFPIFGLALGLAGAALGARNAPAVRR